MKRKRSVSVRTYLINKYGVKPNGEPVINIDSILESKQSDSEKTINLEVTPYSDEMVKNAEDILAGEE